MPLRCLRQIPCSLIIFYAFIYSCHKYFSILCVQGAGLRSAQRVFQAFWIRLQERRKYLCSHVYLGSDFITATKPRSTYHQYYHQLDVKSMPTVPLAQCPELKFVTGFFQLSALPSLLSTLSFHHSSTLSSSLDCKLP